ncbi:MAG: phospholipase D family protein [Candidatus Aenigmatarchaeota archaeon]
MKENALNSTIRLIPLIIVVYIFFFLSLSFRSYTNFSFFDNNLTFYAILSIITFAFLMTTSAFLFMRHSSSPGSKRDALLIKSNWEQENIIDKMKKKIKKLEKEKKTQNDVIQNYKNAMNEKDICSFLKTTPDDKIYEKEVRSQIKNAKKSLYICNAFWDHIFSRDVLSLEGVCTVRIITRPKGNEKYHEDVIRDLKNAFRANLKFDKTIHARIIIIDESKVIIGSGNLDTHSMHNNLEAGVLSENPVIVGEAIKFFKSIWNKNEKNKI